MADNDRNSSEDDLADGDAGEINKILGLPKPLFIKAAIGLTLLILAGGGAFFFLGSEEAIETIEVADDLLAPDGTAENNQAEMRSETADKTEMAERIMQLREESVVIKEENIQLREYILGLETEINALKSAAKPVNNQRKPDAAFLNSYGDDSNAFPPIVTEKPKPKPEPRWGEFKRPAS